MLVDFDHHTHTLYSTHSDPDMTVANNLAAAAEAGLRRHVILEHVPEIGPARPTVESWYRAKNERPQLDAIARDLKNLRHAERYPQLTVLRGVELDADPITLDGSAMLDDLSNLDVVLGSTHVFPGGAAFWYDKISLPPDAAQRVALQWRDWTIRFMASGVVDVMSHPGDLVGARQLVPPFHAHETLQFFLPILEALGQHSVAFELNELLAAKLPPTYRNGYVELVRLAHQVGLKFSVGSDAHAPAQIGQYAWVLSLIEQAGLQPDDFWTPELKREG